MNLDFCQKHCALNHDSYLYGRVLQQESTIYVSMQEEDILEHTHARYLLCTLLVLTCSYMHVGITDAVGFRV